MNVAFVNLSCRSFSYPVANHFLELFENIGKPGFLYVHFWDVDMGSLISGNLSEKVAQLSKEQKELLTSQVNNFLDSYSIKHEILYHSVSRERLFRNEETNNVFFQSLTGLSLPEINEAYMKEHHLSKRPSTFGRVIYIVIDFLTFANFKKIYPEFENIPNLYYAGVRFKPVVEKLREFYAETPKAKFYFAESIPIINYSENKWFDTLMPAAIIEAQLMKHFAGKVPEYEICDLLKVLSRLLGNSFLLPGSNSKINLDEAKKYCRRSDPEKLAGFFALNFEKYFKILKEKISFAVNEKNSKIFYVKTGRELESLLLILNPKKFELLKFCNGSNEISQICEKLELKKNSVQSYISVLKKNGFLTGDKKPRRKIEKIIVDFE